MFLAHTIELMRHKTIIGFLILIMIMMPILTAFNHCIGMIGSKAMMNDVYVNSSISPSQPTFDTIPLQENLLKEQLNQRHCQGKTQISCLLHLCSNVAIAQAFTASVLFILSFMMIPYIAAAVDDISLSPVFRPPIKD